MKEIDRKGLRTWIEVDKKAIESNYSYFRNVIPSNTKFCAVVKSNAYGHGLVDFSKTVEKIGVDFLAVDSVVEALRLRKEGLQKPILVLGYTLPEMVSGSVDADISITVSSFEALNSVIENGEKIKIHIKIDTGMHRQGFQPNQREQLFKLLNSHRETVLLEGVYTHFAEAKNPEDRAFTEKQIKEFLEWKKSFLDNEFSPLFHASATAGVLNYPATHFDMVRVGMGLYGYYPSEQSKKEVDLKPVLSWKSLVSEIKCIQAGEAIGYDRSYIAQSDMKIAIVPVGYWHGYDRALSNTGKVLVLDQLCDVIGKVSMDMIIVDVTKLMDVSVGDVVALLSSGKDSQITAIDVARMYNGSFYELLTKLNPLIKRFYL